MASTSFDYLTGSCPLLTNCTMGRTFQTGVPTGTTDRVCGSCGACSAGQELVSGNVDVIFGPFPAYPQPFSTPHTPCGVLYLETMVLGC